MADSKSIDTLMPTNGKFDRDEHGQDIEVKMYRINFCEVNSPSHPMR